MTTRRVIVPWEKGLHLRAAAKLVRLAQTFHSTIRIHCGGQVANLRSIISVVSLCAVMGSALEIKVTGDDELEAVQAVEQVFLVEDDIGP
jgi:phosphocarrier protein HPr